MIITGLFIYLLIGLAILLFASRDNLILTEDIIEIVFLFPITFSFYFFQTLKKYLTKKK